MAWRVDLAISGPGWLERTGTLRSSIQASDEASPFSTLPVGATLSYLLTDATGATAASGTATSSALTFTTAIALGADLDPDVAYLEKWSGTIDGSTVEQYREARVSRHAASRRTYPTTTLSVIGTQPVLWTYPSGSTSWQTQIGEAWSTIAYRLWATGPRGDVWTPGQLSMPTVYLARSLIYQQGAVTAGDAWAAQAAAWRAEYERWWESARLLMDPDTSGTPDGPAVTVGGMGPSAGPIMR